LGAGFLAAEPAAAVPDRDVRGGFDPAFLGASPGAADGFDGTAFAAATLEGRVGAAGARSAAAGLSGEIALGLGSGVAGSRFAGSGVAGSGLAGSGFAARARFGAGSVIAPGSAERSAIGAAAGASVAASRGG